MNRADLGHMGEAVAAKYYIRQGYLLLNHNYRTRMGELDLILYKADTIVFAEVKTRTSAQRAAPAEAVDYYKQQRLIAAAGQYLQQSPYACLLYTSEAWRHRGDLHRPPHLLWCWC